MYKKHNERHFISHTLEHLLGVFAIVAVATTVGYFASAQTATTDTAAPTFPAIDLLGTAWNKVDMQFFAIDNVGVVSFDVFRREGAVPTASDFIRSVPYIAEANRTPYSDTTMPPGKLYYYAIKAHDAAGNVSVFSPAPTVMVPQAPPDTVAPTAVQTFYISSVAYGQINLAWSGATDDRGITGYKLFRNGIALIVQGTNYSDVNVEPGVSYSYYVKAYDAAGNISLASDSVTATATATAPAAQTQAPAPELTSTSSPTSVAPTSDTPSIVTQPTPVPATNESVSFAATPAPVTDCSTSQPMTKVFLAVSNALGGSFEISSDTGIANARLEWGEYPLPNGTYTWRGIANSGYVSTGGSGSFVLNGVCLSSFSGANDWMKDASPLDYPETSLVTPRVFLGTTPVVNGGTISGMVNFIATPSDASRTGFVLYSPTLGTKFFGGDQGVVHDPALRTWKLNWHSASVPNGDYVLVAILDTQEGVLRSTKVLLRIENAASLVSPTAAAPVAPAIAPTITPTNITTSTSELRTVTDTPIITSRPVLKLFLDNRPVTDPSRSFNDEEVELRVIAALAKKVNLVAIENNTNVATQLGSGVIDDLLTTPGMDVWTYVWNTANVKEGSYRVFARVLRTDGTTVETAPVLLRIRKSAAPAPTPSPVLESGAHALIAPTASERQQILDRVSNPANCTNAEECKIFCASHVDVKDQCVQFSRVSLGALPENPPSFTDGIADDRVNAMLNDPRRRPKALPEIVASAEDLRFYCAQSAHADICTKALVSNDLASSDTLEQKKTDITHARSEEQKLFTERVGARMFIDSDNDGITDYDEVNIYRTSLSEPDTDYDGFFDGAEILAGTNPNGSAPQSTVTESLEGSSSDHVIRASEEMNVENPLIAGETQSSLLSVTTVVVAEVGLNEKGTTTVKKFKLTGRALPNSFVRIYVFSDPIVVTVKSDDTGAWTYVLDKELPDGTHQIVSAITDSGGRILAKSEPLPFVKEAAAVSVGTLLFPEAQAAPGFFSGASLYALIAILIALLGLGFSVIGFMVYRKKDTDEPTLIA